MMAFQRLCSTLFRIPELHAPVTVILHGLGDQWPNLSNKGKAMYI